jgi:hypothetical protein
MSDPFHAPLWRERQFWISAFVVIGGRSRHHPPATLELFPRIRGCSKAGFSPSSTCVRRPQKGGFSIQDEAEISYDTTEKGTPFKGTEVSRRSVADLMVKIIHLPTHRSIGVNKPGTEGDKPSFY